MNVQFYSQHIVLSESQKDYITEKISRLPRMTKYLEDTATSIKVEVKHINASDPSEMIELDLNVIIPHAQFRVSDTAKTPEEAIDNCVEKLKPQLEKHKAKYDHSHDATKIDDNVEGEFDSLI